MTGNRTRAATVAAAAAGLACAGCSWLIPATPGPAQGPAVRHQAAPAASTSPAAGSTPAPARLPFSAAQLSAAAALAARFAVTWDTWSWRQPPGAWLAGLQPMTAAGLYAALAASASTPGLLAARNATRQAATATATGAEIRDLTPGSATITVTIRQVTTATTGVTTTTASLAVTLTPAPAGGWQVYDIEPAAAGNS
jgi:hypothetical protein